MAMGCRWDICVSGTRHWWKHIEISISVIADSRVESNRHRFFFFVLSQNTSRPADRQAGRLFATEGKDGQGGL